MTDHALTLMQWLSPAFPVGAFAYSHGLEKVIADGTVRDAPTLQQWLSDLLTHGSGRADAILLAAAYSTEDPSDDRRNRARLCCQCRTPDGDRSSGWGLLRHGPGCLGAAIAGPDLSGRRWMCGPRHGHTAGADTAALSASLCKQSGLGRATRPSPWANRRATGAGGAFQHDLKCCKRQQGGIP